MSPKQKRIKVPRTPPKLNRRGKLINRDIPRRYLVTAQDREESTRRFGQFGYAPTEDEEETTSRQKQKQAERKLKRFMRRGGSREHLQRFVEKAYDSGDSEMIRAILKLAGCFKNPKTLHRLAT